jgi:hypothetical protein
MKRIAPHSNVLDWLLRMATAGLVLTVLCGCCGTYCQSGPKYGTQCRNINDVEWQRTQQREEPWPAAQTNTAAPGCLLVSPTKLAQQSLTVGPTNSAASVPPPYLMSGACLSRQQPVYGAVR